MRKFYTLLSREVRSYFYSPVAYIVLVCEKVRRARHGEIERIRGLPERLS